MARNIRANQTITMRRIRTRIARPRAWVVGGFAGRFRAACGKVESSRMNIVYLLPTRVRLGHEHNARDWGTIVTTGRMRPDQKMAKGSRRSDPTPR